MKNIERQIPKPFEIYRHFKGNLYQILNTAVHSETGEILVVYQALYSGFGIYARPLDMFLSEVDHVKYPDSKEQYRFTSISSEAAPVPGSITASPDACIKSTGEKYGANVNIADNHTDNSEAALQNNEVSAGYETENQQKRANELFMEFLDEDNFMKKRNILKSIAGIATDSMINNMAASLDLVTTGISREGDVKMIDDYIRARIHFDGARLRE